MAIKYVTEIRLFESLDTTKITRRWKVLWWTKIDFWSEMIFHCRMLKNLHQKENKMESKSKDYALIIRLTFSIWCRIEKFTSIRSRISYKNAWHRTQLNNWETEKTKQNRVNLPGRGRSHKCTPNTQTVCYLIEFDINPKCAEKENFISDY